MVNHVKCYIELCDTMKVIATGLKDQNTENKAKGKKKNKKQKNGELLQANFVTMARSSFMDLLFHL